MEKVDSIVSMLQEDFEDSGILVCTFYSKIGDKYLYYTVDGDKLLGTSSFSTIIDIYNKWLTDEDIPERG